MLQVHSVPDPVYAPCRIDLSGLLARDSTHRPGSPGGLDMGDGLGVGPGEIDFHKRYRAHAADSFLIIDAINQHSVCRFTGGEAIVCRLLTLR
jgi:hypothetical protein